MRGLVAPLAGLLVVLLTATAGRAQEVRQPAPRGESVRGLSPATFAARQTRRLLARDTDGDGRVSRAEFLAGAGRGKGDPGKRFAGIDRNGDGAIDRGEMDAAAARRFARLDTDRNGVLVPAERVRKQARAGATGSTT